MKVCPQETQLRRFRRLRSTRRVTVLHASKLPSPARGMEIYGPAPLQTQACVSWTSREHNHSTAPARDRLAHKGWACAYRLRPVVPGLNHQQTPPSSKSWTADG